MGLNVPELMGSGIAVELQLHPQLLFYLPSHPTRCLPPPGLGHIPHGSMVALVGPTVATFFWQSTLRPFHPFFPIPAVSQVTCDLVLLVYYDWRYVFQMYLHCSPI